MPPLSRMAVIVSEFDDVFRLGKPPWPVQKAAVGAAAAVGRLRGHRP